MSDEKPSVELSADGKRNAFTHQCTPVGHSKNYAVCLHLIERVNKEGSLPSIYSDCEGAIRRGNCQAKKMRKEEIEKGVPIYFVERVRSEPQFMEPGYVVKTVVSNYKKGRKSSAKPSPAPVAKPKTKEELFLSGGGSYEEAINSAIEEAPVAMAKVTSIQGETMLEMAKRVIRENQLKGAVA